MIKKNQTALNFFNMLSDAVLILLAYYGALMVRFEVMDGLKIYLFQGSRQFLAALVYSCAIVLVFYLLGMYSSHRFHRTSSEAFLIAGVNAVGVLLLMSYLYIIRFGDISRLLIFFVWLFSSLLVTIKRIAVRAVLRHYRALGYNQKHVVVVGNGHLAAQYIKDIAEHPEFGITVDGYFSKTVREELGTNLGSYEDLEACLERNGYDEVIVALGPHEAEYVKSVLAAAGKEGVRISIIPFYNDYIPPHPTIQAVGDSRLIDMRATPLDKTGNALLKRTMDVCGALALIVLTGPIMLAIAIGVKLSSPGPILFRQERVGKNKKTFKMLKFRSMRITGTEDTGWSKDVDPRKTKFGSFIRKCSLDELPQFFNVLKGDMSLIGPRPEVPFHVGHFKEEIPLYLVRQQVRPGITGWAQVNGLRGDTSIEERVKYDIWYIENWSFGLDIKILFKTAFGGMINNESVSGSK